MTEGSESPLTEAQRIEKSANEWFEKLPWVASYKIPLVKEGYIAGATAERERKDEKYNDLKALIQRHFQTLIARNYNNIGVWSNERQDYNFQLISELEELLKQHHLKSLKSDSK